jgi:hypothetical protein
MFTSRVLYHLAKFICCKKCSLGLTRHTYTLLVACLHIHALNCQVKEGVVKLAGQRRAEAIANYGVVGIGIIMGVLGAVISVLESFFPHVLGI